MHDPAPHPASQADRRRSASHRRIARSPTPHCRRAARLRHSPGPRPKGAARRPRPPAGVGRPDRSRWRDTPRMDHARPERRRGTPRRRLGNRPRRDRARPRSRGGSLAEPPPLGRCSAPRPAGQAPAGRKKARRRAAASRRQGWQAIGAKKTLWYHYITELPSTGADTLVRLGPGTHNRATMPRQPFLPE